jgi:hypothetical protein
MNTNGVLYPAHFGTDTIDLGFDGELEQLTFPEG